MKEITTIKISKQTLIQISKLKIHPRQSYEEVIITLLKKRGDRIEKDKESSSD